MNEENEVTQEQTPDSSSDFFAQLEGSVNGVVTEGSNQEESVQEEVTHQRVDGSNQESWDNESNPYKKRYKDSSREAVKLNDKLRQLEPFMPVLEAMKTDSGLVDHVRNYLQGGGQPTQDVKEQLGLSEDFQYDPTEAIENPSSDSARVLATHVDSVVQERIGQVLTQEKQNAAQVQARLLQKKQEDDFRSKHGMTEEEFNSFRNDAKERKLTLDDVYFILNKDKSNKNVADATKADMLSQMKNVRNMPTSASDSNSQGSGKKGASDQLFDGLLDLDGNVDNLFG
tara:strand:- start:1399 stop:2253 length:855 start_codon:yes stop_codon:yes gene_type:complete